MCATTISSATGASGGKSEPSNRSTPTANESWRQTLTGLPRRASVCTRFA